MKLYLIFPKKTGIMDQNNRGDNMYNSGDYAVVSGSGVCRVDSVGRLSIPGADPDKEYYTLRPVDDNCVLHIPADISDERMRPIITRNQAISLIKNIPNVTISKKKDNQRLARYKEILADGKPEALLNVVIEIYQLNADSLAKGKPIEKMTEASIFRDAEFLFNSEISKAIGCEPSEVPEVIQNILSAADFEENG